MIKATWNILTILSKIVAVSPDLKSFTIIRELTTGQARHIRQELNLI